MIDRYRVKLARRVATQLEEIFEYISKDSPANAASMTDKLVSAIDSLEHFPQRCARADESLDPAGELRCMSVRPYRIFYRIDENAKLVEIVSVRHSARRPGI